MTPQFTFPCLAAVAALLLPAMAPGGEPKHSFIRDVQPIFTMAGCAGSNCHGSIRGQAEFKLSLFGYEPEADYEAITHPDRPRIDPSNPRESLILRKATMQVGHGGGMRLATDSLEYRTILEWVRDGAPFDDPGAPRIARLEVTPGDLLLTGAGAKAQLSAKAFYTDGSERDVTHLVQYSSNNPDVVQVSKDGALEALQTGETAVMVRTLGEAVAARVAIRESAPGPDYPRVPRQNFVDEHVFAKLEKLNIRPSRLTSDEEFLRRVYLDTIGLPPSLAEAEAFLASNDPAKREKLIGALLERPEFAQLWALKFSETFRTGTREAGAKGARIMYRYLERSFDENKPWSAIAAELLTSQGPHMYRDEPSSFYNITFDSNAADHATNASQLFLGVRLECAKCHNHPWEKWTQDDFYGFAAFFARVKIKEVYENDENAHYYAEEGEVVHPKTKQTVTPRFLDGGYVEDAPDKDIREDLAAWMAAPGNPFFAPAAVNRVWKHFLGRGLVEELDDFRVTNPPSNPALLDALAAHFIASGFDWKALCRTILESRTYQLSAEPDESNRHDELNYSRYYMKRLMAEQLADSVALVTGVDERYPGYPPGTRAMQVYAGSGGYMMAAFGRLNRDIICERDTAPTLTQSMHWISGDTLATKIHSPDSVLARWAADESLSGGRLVERIFLAALTRAPTEAERAAALQTLANSSRLEAAQDLAWALMNSREFQFNH